jgi:dephospho-CoA kinase
LAEPSIAVKVGRHFGEDVVPDGAVDRGALGRLVFDDPEELGWLEKLLHPHVRRAIAEWADAQARSERTPGLLVAEVPLLLETGMGDTFDYILLVTAPESVRRKRLAAKLTESEFSRRAAQQLDETAKAARCDFVFHNSGSRGRLKDYVSEIFATIIAGDADRSRREP